MTNVVASTKRMSLSWVNRYSDPTSDDSQQGANLAHDHRDAAQHHDRDDEAAECVAADSREEPLADEVDGNGADTNRDAIDPEPSLQDSERAVERDLYDVEREAVHRLRADH